MKAILIWLLMLSAVQVVPADKPAEAKVFYCDSNTSHSFHKSKSCEGLDLCTHVIKEVTKSQALKLGRDSCSYCYPRKWH